jgi:hypothetical protein
MKVVQKSGKFTVCPSKERRGYLGANTKGIAKLVRNLLGKR